VKPGLRRGDALLIVDVQIDFCPGGALPVPWGDAVVPVLNRWIAAARRVGAPVYASRDWHPTGHLSFVSHGGEWPPHCVQDTPGARYHPDLALPEDTIPVCKGTRLDRDQYSAFADTGLAEHLVAAGVERVFIGGLALDVCVRATALDARKRGFEVHLIGDAAQPVDPAAGRATLEELERAGVVVDGGGEEKVPS
jgi:nicotinamidase/pyrazinamidase